MKHLLPILGLAFSAAVGHAQEPGTAPFRRVATFPVFQNTSIDTETVAEIVSATPDGMTLVYTDSANAALGFVDISNPAAPQPAGQVALSGDPTSVTVREGHVLVCVNTSTDFVNVSGDLLVIDIATKQLVATLPLGGQPDAIALSPDGRYAAIAIENERDEDLGDGAPPQAPAGFLQIVDCVGAPATWQTRAVSMVGIPTLFPTDPEPEYVDINDRNFAVVTMQENNHIAIVDLVSGTVVRDFSAGAVNLTQVDATEDDLIMQVESLDGVVREPDAVAWLSNGTFATADEGDLDGGSRGITIWAANGVPIYRAGNELEHATARHGHYPEGRSENKGQEAEGVDYGSYGGDRFLFAVSERANTVSVYELPGEGLAADSAPILRQMLSTGLAPEGVLAIPSRDLLIVASEKDERGDKFRASLTIFERSETANYPSIVSADRADGTPIAWGALSGLAVDPTNADALFTVHDSFYRQSRFYSLGAGSTPMVIRGETVLRDSTGVLRGKLDALKAALPSTATADFDVDALVESDGTVNLDLEGITALTDGTLWLVSEGRGNLAAGVSDPSDRPFESPNLALHVDATGTILDAVLPPQSVTENQLRFGFEGCAVEGGALFVAFQREWMAAGDAAGLVRIGRYDLTAGTWTFAHYPLEAPASANGGWVGLSDLVSLGNGRFTLIERDNQGNVDAAIKRLYTFDITGVTFQDASQVATFPVLAKVLVRDLIAAGDYDAFATLTPEKLEGLAVLPNGDALIVNDNDGVDDNNGETLIVKLPGLFQ